MNVKKAIQYAKEDTNKIMTEYQTTNIVLNITIKTFLTIIYIIGEENKK